MCMASDFLDAKVSKLLGTYTLVSTSLALLRRRLPRLSEGFGGLTIRIYVKNLYLESRYIEQSDCSQLAVRCPSEICLPDWISCR